MLAGARQLDAALRESLPARKWVALAVAHYVSRAQTRMSATLQWTKQKKSASIAAIYRLSVVKGT